MPKKSEINKSSIEKKVTIIMNKLKFLNDTVIESSNLRKFIKTELNCSERTTYRVLNSMNKNNRITTKTYYKIKA